MSIRQALTVFDQIVDASPAERLAVLETIPPDVGALVREMLRADGASRRFLTGGAADLLSNQLHEDEKIPHELPGYRVIREVGRGGMGRVFEARQARPDRSVALKVIHPWLVSAQTRAQLHDEAAALGAIIHPGVPQIYALEEVDGLLFLVMELVEGHELIDAAAGRSLRDRVELGVRTGEAISAAHSRGLLHLDIKPGNVRVTAEDEPKVLDFGLARIVGSEAAPIAAGTPGFMAPEQQRGERPDVRTDVYGLGRLLRVLLTGQLNGVPAVPDLAAVLDRATAQRPEDRYGSVGEVVRDLRAWLELRPVSVRKRGPLSVVLLAARRNPVPAVAVALIVAVLVGASVWSLDLAQQADLARQQAEQARIEAEHATTAAEQDARRAKDAAGFLTDVFLLLSPGHNTGERTLLDATLTALEKLDDGALADAPREAAAVRTAAAEALWNLERRDEAEVQIFAAVQIYDDPAIEPDATLVDALHSAAIVTRLGRFKEGRGEVEEMTRAWEYLDRAEALSDQLDEPEARAEILHSRGVWKHNTSEYAESEEVLGRAVALKRALLKAGEIEADGLPNTLNQLGHVRMMLGEFTRAQEVFDEALAIRREAYPGAHPGVATCLHWKAMLAVERGEPERALALLDEVTAMRDELGHPRHTTSRTSELAWRGRALADLGRWSEAETQMLAYIDVELDGDATRLRRETAWTLVRALFGQERDAEAQQVVTHALAYDEDRPEGTGGWAWYYTLNGRWKAARGERGAKADIEAALTVWVPRFRERGPRAASLLALLETL